MRALEIFDTDEHGKLGGSLAEILRLADPPASRLVWTLRYIEARDDVTAAWPAGLKDLEAQASAHKFGLVLSWETLLSLATLFRIAARERRVLTKLEQRFKDTRPVELSEMY